MYRNISRYNLRNSRLKSDTGLNIQNAARDQIVVVVFREKTSFIRFTSPTGVEKTDVGV